MIGKHGSLAGLGRVVLILGVVWPALAVPAAEPASVGAEAKTALENMGTKKGICVVLGLPQADKPGFVTDLVAGSELLVFFQSPEADQVDGVREAADTAGLLGKRVFVDRGRWQSIHLADNLAGAILVGPSAQNRVSRDELLRVLHPQGKAIVGRTEITKPFPRGTDDWSHTHHGPDNNPQSTDRIARWPCLTQFLAEPMFCPMPEVSVASGGKVYRAFGHIAHKANQNAMLNTLICVNGYNGMVLWKRPLKEGFMIHRSTMIATPATLYLADDESCKLIDAETGKVNDEIVIPAGVADGPVWKWMALEDGILYALVGGREPTVPTQRSQTPGLGHWPWGMWPGHDYKDPKTSFGFGRTFLAIDPHTKKILWSHRENEYLDSRGVCMNAGRIYFYAPEKLLGCLDAKAGKPLWKTSAADLLEAIGPNGRAQHYVTGYSTTTYIKCNDKFIFFAGPQRSRLVVVSAEDGKLLWQKEPGNYQLVLREDAFYAVGPGTSGCKLEYETGKELARLPHRRACTRATGSIDSVFYRTSGGTVRIDVASNTARHIAPMRPACQDGVIISDGLLYWGPWMCGCQLSLYGHISLAPAGEFGCSPPGEDARLEPGQGDIASVEPFEIKPGDWPSYRGDSRRTSLSKLKIPRRVERKWRFRSSSSGMPTAPTTVGGIVFVGDRAGVVRAINAHGKLLWKAYTGGAIYFPPTLADRRAYVGSADGRVYAFEAATGRLLWSFRVAPCERWIPVYGKLISTWPVAGGVVVHDGVVYAAAGIAHYDGTHVVALDAVSGEVKWSNSSSGMLSETAQSGVSLQGNLQIRDGQLCFLGGGVCETARFDLKTGKCLNRPYEGVNSRFHTAFYAYYPQYGKYLSLDHTLADGRTLCYDASYEGSRHWPLSLLGPLPPGVPKPKKPESRWGRMQQSKPKPKVLWAEKSGRRFTSFVVTEDVLLAAGQSGSPETSEAFLAAVNIEDGSDIWQRPLPACVVKGGVAMDSSGRILLCLEDGQIICLAAAE